MEQFYLTIHLSAFFGLFNVDIKTTLKGVSCWTREPSQNFELTPSFNLQG